MAGSRTLVAGIAVAAAACSPVFDWRDVRPTGSGAQALFPCKPEVRTRRITLGGEPVEMTLLACNAGGATFGFAFADVQDPARVAGALGALAQATAGNLQAPAPTAVALQVPGMTPNAAARRLRIEGRRPEGEAVRAEAALFSKGTRVFQATVVGAKPDATAVDTFFGALRVDG